MLIVNKIFRVTVLLLIYLILPLIYARTDENVETVNDFVLNQEDKPQTYRTVRDIITGDGYSSVVCIPDYL